MKNIRKIALLVGVALMLVCLSFALISCGECKHEYGEWTANGEATCQGQDQIHTCDKCGSTETRVSTEAAVADAHTYGDWESDGEATCQGQNQIRTCSACGAQDKRTNTEATAEHAYSTWTVTGNVYSNGIEETRVCSVCSNVDTRYTTPVIEVAEFDKAGIYVTNLEINITDDYNLSENGVIKLDIGEGYLALDENGALSGYGYGVIKSDASETDLLTQTDCTFFIEDGWVYAFFSGTPDISETLDGVQYAKLCLESSTDTAELESTLAEVEALLPEIETWYTDTFAPLFENVNVDGVSDRVSLLMSELVNNLILVTTHEDGSYDLSINYAFFKEINETLGQSSISEIYDIVVGDGAYAELEELFTTEAIYEYSVADLLDYIQVDQGVSLSATLDAIDALLVIVTGQDGATLEMLISSYTGEELPEGFDIYDYITNEELTGLTVMDALLLAFEAPLEDDAETADVNERAEAEKAIKEQLAQIVSLLKETSAYDMIIAQNSDVDADTLIGTINDAIDEIVNSYSYVWSFDSTGAFTGLNISYTFEDEYDGTIEINLVADKDFNITCSVSSDSDYQKIDLEFEIVPGESIEINQDKVDEIKAALDKVPAFTQDDIIAMLEEKYSGKACYVVYNSEDDCYYVFIYNYLNSQVLDDGNTNYTLYYNIYQVEPNYSSVYYTPGCSGTDLFNTDFNGREAYSVAYTINSADSTLTVEELRSEVDYDALLSAANFSTECSVDFYFKAVDGVISTITRSTYSDFGHDYAYDEEGSTTSDVCLEIYKDHYVCSVCGDSYDSYQTVEHDTYAEVSLIDGTLAGGYKYCYYCDNCDYEEIYYTVNVETEYNVEYYENEYHAAFTLTVEESGTYYFYSTCDVEGYCDTYAYIEMLDENGNVENVSYTNNDNNGQFSIEVYLEAGNTYIFSTGSYYGPSYTVVLE